MVERQDGRKIKIMRTNGGGEYVSKYFNTLCSKEGIMHKVVPSYTYQLNGTAEINNITIMNMVRSMLKDKHLLNELYDEVVSTATYILNKCSTKRLKSITPDDCCYGVKPSLNHLKVIGSITHRHVPYQLRRNMDDKSSQMILVGYHSTGGYKLFDLVNKQVVINMDLIMHELKECD